MSHAVMYLHVMCSVTQCGAVIITVLTLSQNSAQGAQLLSSAASTMIPGQVVRQWTDENICMCKMNIYQDKPSKSQTKVGLLAAVVISVHA